MSPSASPILLCSTVSLFSPGVRPCLTVCAASPFYSSRLTTPFRSYLFHLPTSFTSSFSHSLPAAVVLSVSHLSLPAEMSSAVALQLFGFWNWSQKPGGRPLGSHSVPAFRIGSSEQLDEGDGAAAHLQLIFGPWQIEMPIIGLLFSEADSS